MNGHLAIQARLSGAAGLSALVSDRIYADVMPDSPTMPAVTYQQTSGSSDRGSVSDPPLKKAMFQVSAWGKTRYQVLQIAAQIRLALDRVRQTTAGGVQIDDCFYEGTVDMYDPEAKIFVTHTDFRLHYREAA